VFVSYGSPVLFESISDVFTLNLNKKLVVYLTDDELFAGSDVVDLGDFLAADGKYSLGLNIYALKTIFSVTEF
jgi:hypothetical protein